MTVYETVHIPAESDGGGNTSSSVCVSARRVLRGRIRDFNNSLLMIIRGENMSALPELSFDLLIILQLGLESLT